MLATTILIYNQTYSEHSDFISAWMYSVCAQLEEIEALDASGMKKIILDYDTRTKKELIVVNPTLAQKLMDHQIKGVRFMWHACFESVQRIKKDDGGGCLLAHCMGLGKTLQVFLKLQLRIVIYNMMDFL